jgi:N-acetyl-anhydromuramyl-L-alanine amidase AmpD
MSKGIEESKYICVDRNLRESLHELSGKNSIIMLNPQLSLYYTWHAGVSEWNGHKNINSISFGIEQEHLVGDVWPAAQVEACAELCRWLSDRYGNGRKLPIVGHAAVARPKGRKTDPERYPWAEFSKYFQKIF